MMVDTSENQLDGGYDKQLVSVVVPADLKAESEAILAGLGMAADQAISLFYEEIRLRGELPFSMDLPQSGDDA